MVIKLVRQLMMHGLLINAINAVMNLMEIKNVM